MIWPRLYSIQAKFSILLIIMVCVILCSEIFSVFFSQRFLEATKFFVDGTLPRIRMGRTLEKAVSQLGSFSREFGHRTILDNLQQRYSELRGTLEEVESLTATISQEEGLVDILSLNLVSQAIRSHAAVVFQVELDIAQKEEQMHLAIASLQKAVQEQTGSSAQNEGRRPIFSLPQEILQIAGAVGLIQNPEEIESLHAHLDSVSEGEWILGEHLHRLEGILSTKRIILDAQQNLSILVNELIGLSKRLDQLTTSYVENVFDQYQRNSKDIITEIEGVIRIKLLLGIILIVVLCFLYWIIVIRGFGARLSMISRAMGEDSVEKGTWSIPLAGKDEIADMARSASALLEKARRLRDLATIDELTQAYNRRRFFELAAKEAKRAARSGLSAVVLMIDLDHFKQINDTHGHDFGDRVLQEAARACKQTIREIDIFARYGGEEFVLLMPETTEEQGIAAAQRILATVASLQWADGGEGPVQVTASIGLAEAHLESIRIDSALKNADIALYRAKELGRNRVELFQEEVAAVGFNDRAL